MRRIRNSTETQTCHGLSAAVVMLALANLSGALEAAVERGTTVRAYTMYDPQVEHQWIFSEKAETDDDDRYCHMVDIAFFRAEGAEGGGAEGAEGVTSCPRKGSPRRARRARRGRRRGSHL